MFNLLGLSSWFAVTFPWIVKYISNYVDPSYLSLFHYEDVKLENSYDFIIIGAGSAGSVVANRLSEVAYWSILLVEAGGQEDIVSDVPILSLNLWNTDKDWNFTTVKQKFACRARQGLCPYTSGHVLGGTSTINSMLYTRGNRFDFDNWRKQGNDGWSYLDVLPYFLKSEDIRIRSLENSPYHATGGYLTVDEPDYSPPIQRIIMDSLNQMGFKRTEYNGQIQTGYAYPQFTLRDGTRCSTAKAFLSSVKNRPNIHISQRTLALKIDLNSRKDRATGVTLVKGGKIYNIKANNDVIVSTGAINTPKMLMLSGIGPKDHLKKQGIIPKVNLPVGLNLVDHSYITLPFLLNKNLTLTPKKIESVKAMINYAMERTGPISSPAGTVALNFFTLDKIFRPLPDIYCIITIYNVFGEEPLVVFTLAKLRPKSTGSVKLKSSNPYDPPLIDPQYYSNQKDFTDTVKACLTILEIGKTLAMSRYKAQIVPPGEFCYGKIGKDYCECVVTFYSNPMYHSVGTARMALDGVVSSTLQVWGVPNLRVIDASIMPNITSGSTNVPTIMIAEKGADMIKSHYRAFEFR